MRELEISEIDAVSGARSMNEVYVSSGAVVAAGLLGFAFGGPIGAGAAALSVGMHAMLISALN